MIQKRLSLFKAEPKLHCITWKSGKPSKLSPIHSITQFVTDLHGDEAKKKKKKKSKWQTQKKIN